MLKCGTQMKKELNIHDGMNVYDIINICKQLDMDTDDMINVKKMPKSDMKYLVENYKNTYQEELSISLKL